MRKARLDEVPLGRVGDVLLEPPRGAWRGADPCRRPRRSGALPHHLGQRPVGDALAVGEAAAAMPVHDAAACRRGTCPTPTRGGTCRCPPAGHRDERARPSSRRRVEQLLDHRSAPRRGRRTAARAPSTRSAPPTPATTRSGLPQRRRARPCPSGSDARRSRRRSPRSVARRVDSPTKTVPALPAAGRATAVLTRSPATMPSPLGAEVTAASPVRRLRGRAARERRPRPRAPHRGDQVERRADRALGVVLVRDGRSPDGHDGVADELLDRAAVALDQPAAGVEVAREQLAGVLRVAALRGGGEADEVGEEH